MSEEEYKEMRSIVVLGCVNITKDGIAHMSKKTFEKKEQQRDLYKEVIEEARGHIEETCYYPVEKNYSSMTANEVKELLQILDKAKENK